MAEKIDKLKYEPGNSQDTSDRPMTCPSGHPLRRSRGGHLNCTVCDWTDRNRVMGAKPIEVIGKNEDVNNPRNRKPAGVTVMSDRGVEQRGKPNIVSR